MADYSMVIGSKFSPFSYEELLKPALMATQAHQELENQYSELATKANVWEEMANEQTDPYAYKMYKSYANDLENQAGQLAREGLTPASRQNMLKMKQRYSSDIVPIEQAYKRRQELIDEQRKLQAQDNTLMFDRNASMMSLDDLIRNPQLTYQTQSGAVLAKQVGTAAKALADQVRNNKSEWYNILGGQYYETLEQRGFKPEEVLQAIQNNPNASSILTNIVKDVIGSSRVASWGDADILRRAYGYANQGLWEAVGKSSTDRLANKNYVATNPGNGGGQQPMSLGLAINPLNIFSSRELKEEKKYKNAIDIYSKYFTTDAKGNVRLTVEGMEEYRRKIKGIIGKPLVTPEGTTILTEAQQILSDSPFKEFMNSIGMDPKLADIDNWNSYAIGKLWSDYVNNSPYSKMSKYDATKVTEFDYTIAGAQQGDMKDAIMTAGRGTTLKEVDFDSKSKQFKDTGEEITMEDLKKDGYKVTATRFSPYGNTVMIQDDKGNVRRFRMPAGINTYNEGFRDEMMKDILKYQELLKNPNLSQEDRRSIEIEYNNSLQLAYLYHSQLGVQNQVNEQKFNAYGY